MMMMATNRRLLPSLGVRAESVNLNNERGLLKPSH